MLDEKAYFMRKMRNSASQREVLEVKVPVSNVISS